MFTGPRQTRRQAQVQEALRRGFGQPNSTPHPGISSVGAELLQDFIRQDGGSTETLSEAPGAYGCSCGDSPARSAPYETTLALAPWPNPEMGVETRYSPGSDYTGLPQDLQPVVRSLVPSGRSAPGAGIQTCCVTHGCLGHQLGSHVQRASIKRVGDLQAFSVDDSCLKFGPGDSSATLRPRPSYVPKVPTTPFRDQVLNLQALPLEEADPALALLCPVRALSVTEDSRRGRLSASRGWPTG